jgi:hypothetical protein
LYRWISASNIARQTSTNYWRLVNIAMKPDFVSVLDHAFYCCRVLLNAPCRDKECLF